MNSLYHFGILGMKWGVRRYQNEDGGLTAAGKRRYMSNLTEKGKTRLEKGKKLRRKDFDVSSQEDQEYIKSLRKDRFSRGEAKRVAQNTKKIMSELNVGREKAQKMAERRELVRDLMKAGATAVGGLLLIRASANGSLDRGIEAASFKASQFASNPKVQRTILKAKKIISDFMTRNDSVVLGSKDFSVSDMLLGLPGK